MKKIAVLLALICLFSCEDLKNCPDVIKGKPENNIVSEADFNTINSLFSGNNLNIEIFLPYRIQSDELGHKHVRCYQYVNNLQVFSDEVIFHFNAQNQYYSLSGEIISGINKSPDSGMSRKDAERLFLKLADEDGRYSSKDLNDKCLQCELGYYDMNAGTGTGAHDFKLAWKIKPEDSDYPYAFINDTDKLGIYYDNGVRY
jgi:hypothetical protein